MSSLSNNYTDNDWWTDALKYVWYHIAHTSQILYIKRPLPTKEWLYSYNISKYCFSKSFMKVDVITPSTQVSRGIQVVPWNFIIDFTSLASAAYHSKLPIHGCCAYLWLYFMFCFQQLHWQIDAAQADHLHDIVQQQLYTQAIVFPQSFFFMNKLWNGLISHTSATSCKHRDILLFTSKPFMNEIFTVVF